ncbi:hypothetical protein A2U01_0093819 [Trifolium medium]|uniref:Uncharacterized protein n=1 Tax=Trifolium medium TaxID=97028 RepID=A0A392UJD3_9FABA|nr:hypothetical protein [Trifolium medium]
MTPQRDILPSQNRKDISLRETAKRRTKAIRAESPLTQSQEDTQEEACPTPPEGDT